MDGNEIITIHLGPYANYVGAFLINQEYLQVFNTIHPVNPFDTDSSAVRGDTGTDRDVLFQLNKPNAANSTTAAGRNKSYYIPRVLFCDFEGAIPIKHANQIAMENFSKTQNFAKNNRNPGYDPLMEYEDTFSSYQSSFYTESYGYKPKQSTPKSTTTTTTQQKANIVTHEHLYWHNILFPHLRPMLSAPEHVILTASSHVLGLQADTLPEASVIMTKPTSATSAKHEETFGETLFDQFRLLVENCDHPQGVRIIVDTTSIWGGICDKLLHHIINEYPTLQSLVIGVSTPYNIDNNSNTSIMNEIFAYNCYTIPYSPFSHMNTSTAGISPSQIKSQAITSREKRMFNHTLFMSQLSHEDKCAFVPIVFPLINELHTFISTKVPQLIHKYQTALKKAISGGDTSNISGGTLNPDTQTNLASLTTTLNQQFTSVLYHYLTAPHIASALFTALLPLYITKSNTSAASTTTNATPQSVVSLSQLIYTIRPRSTFPIATLAHRHDPELYSNTILGKELTQQGKSGNNNDNTNNALQSHKELSLVSQYINTFVDRTLFPTLDLPGIGLVPVLSNMYPQQHQFQIDGYNKALKQYQQQLGMQYTNHTKQSSSSTTSQYDIADLYGGESMEKVDPITAKRQQIIQVANSYTIGQFDEDSMAEKHFPQNNSSSISSISTNATATGSSNNNQPSQHSVVDGVFVSSNNMQYQYECEQRQRKMQRELYSHFSLSRPSQFLFVPKNLQLLPSTPSILFTTNAMSTISDLSQLFSFTNNTNIGMNSTAKGSIDSKTNTTDLTTIPMSYFAKNNTPHSTTPQETFSSIFISPQLGNGIVTLANNLKKNDKSSTRVSSFRDIERDDWFEHYNTLSSIATEYRELDVYGGLDDFDL